MKSFGRDGKMVFNMVLGNCRHVFRPYFWASSIVYTIEMLKTLTAVFVCIFIFERRASCISSPTWRRNSSEVGRFNFIWSSSVGPVITLDSSLLRNAVQIIEMYKWAYKLRSDIVLNIRPPNGVIKEGKLFAISVGSLPLLTLLLLLLLLLLRHGA